MNTKKIIRILVVTVLILTVPLVAMLFTDEVKWGMADFVIIGALLFGAGFVYELLASKTHTRDQKIVTASVLVAVVIYVWAELAVGIFTNLGS